MIYKRSDIMSNNFLNENRCSLDVVVYDSVLVCEACRRYQRFGGTYCRHPHSSDYQKACFNSFICMVIHPGPDQDTWEPRAG
jgi:hypothetical protein